MAGLRYVTVSEFRTRLEQGGGPDQSTDVEIPTSWADADLVPFLADAEAEVDTRLRPRYRVPLTHEPPDPLVVQIVVALAAYHAMLAMRKNTDFEGELDPYLLRRKWAEDLLTKLAQGTAALPDPPGAATGGAQAYDAFGPPGRLFTPEHFGVGMGASQRVTDIRRPLR